MDLDREHEQCGAPYGWATPAQPHRKRARGPHSACSSSSSSLRPLTWPRMAARSVLAVCLPATSPSVLVLLCQAQRLILGTGWLSATLWPPHPSLSSSFVYLPSSATELRFWSFFIFLLDTSEQWVMQFLPASPRDWSGRQVGFLLLLSTVYKTSPWGAVTDPPLSPATTPPHQNLNLSPQHNTNIAPDSQPKAAMSYDRMCVCRVNLCI